MQTVYDWCIFPGCTRDVHPGSLYCSISHRDQARTLTCQYPDCTRQCYPGSAFCSRSHRDNAPQTQTARRKASPPPALRTTKGISDDDEWPALSASSSSWRSSRRLSDEAEIPISKKVARALQHRFTLVSNLFLELDQRKHDHAQSTSPEPGASSEVSHDPLEMRTKPRADETRILFYDKDEPYYEFTNFAAYEVMHEGKTYPTSEHLFQAFKFADEEDAELIRTQPTPREAFQMAQAMREKVRKGWVEENLSVQAMEQAVKLKFTQHEQLKKMLLETRDMQLVEDSPVDAFWGVGADGKGENKLGQILMQLRGHLQDESQKLIL